MNDKIRLLYAEDNPQDADLTRTHFAQEAPDFEIEIVSTGEKCLERLKEQNYDVLLLDYSLPDIDGIDVLRQTIRMGFSLPVVMITGVGEDELVVKALRSGACDYIPKTPGYLSSLPAVLKGIVADYAFKGSMRQLTRKKRKILYVEHHQMDVDLTLKYFEENVSHLVTETVQNCKQALELLKGKNDLDLVLTDLRMPDMNALDFFREVKHSGIDVPFVVVTGKGDEEVAVAAIKLGAYDYVVKREGGCQCLSGRNAS
jgi:DNA-binding NtrC family response regulator